MTSWVDITVMVCTALAGIGCMIWVAWALPAPRKSSRERLRERLWEDSRP